MVVLDARRSASCGRPSSGTTPSRRPTRGGSIDQLARRRGGWAAACGSVPVAAFTITKLSWLHRSEPDAWARVARVLPAARLAHVEAHRRVRHRPRRRVGHRLLLRRARASTGSTCSRSSTAAPTGRRAARACSGRPSRPARRGRSDGRDRRAGHRRQHGGRARASGSRPGDVAISLGTSGTVYAVSESADGRRRRARSPASPTRPAASCRSCAR